MIQDIADFIRHKQAYELFLAAKNLNIHMMTYAMEIIEREEQVEKKKQEKMAKEKVR